MNYMVAMQGVDWIAVLGLPLSVVAIVIAWRANDHSKEANKIAKDQQQREQTAEERGRNANEHRDKVEELRTAGREIGNRLASIRWPDALDTSEQRDGIYRLIVIEQRNAIRLFRKAQAENVLMPSIPLSKELAEEPAWAVLARAAADLWPVPSLSEIGTPIRAVSETITEYGFNDKRSLPLVRTHAIALVQAVVLYGVTRPPMVVDSPSRTAAERDR